MSRPLLEVADIFRAYAGRFLERCRTRISWPQHQVLQAIERSRTSVLGKHRDRCTGCGHEFAFSFNSCLMGSIF
uniref:Transposase n=1 Tax=Solibacter usitatus (strain Ellin6076) TaxID=234267 RepID=Q01TJ0_SOLUE